MFALETHEKMISKLRTATGGILRRMTLGFRLSFPGPDPDWREQHATLAGALDQIEEGILVFDNRLRLTLANRAARVRLDGIRRQTRPGQDLEAFLQALGRMTGFAPARPVRSLVDLARQGEPWQIRLTGEIAACRLICSPLPGGGVTLVLLDIAQQRQSLRVVG